ncbi:sensor histidine kinase [Tichowtungia aerotolerans]|uniref:histidine kinase n=1 Tax=Tichowtungia aerotolerans TaxID=2697043 RepID=A0A6P1MA57_9BACT|nr:HAMP domain-containing sensor histidine kinase [Tichowtungia aerotolerans]QHI70711.1 hypothetical protein GT409_15110 [Tichowtungia aerotolerans]
MIKPWPTRFSNKPETSPLKRAAVSSFFYITICIFYILFSGQLAAKVAQTPEELKQIEVVKGIAFIIVTGILFFILSFAWWRRTRLQHELLLQSERKAIAAMCSASLAHDLNNLLMSLSGLVEGLKGRERNDSFLVNMRKLLEEGIENLARMARHMAASTKQLQTQETEKIALSSALPQIVELIRKHPNVRTCSLKITGDTNVPLTLHPRLLEQAVINLVVNAAQATGKRGKIELALKQEENVLFLEVHDNGPGIDAETAKAVFTSGFTTKTDGTGLGLLSVQAFASSCKAEITIGKSHLGGAVFRLAIPLPEAPSRGREKRTERIQEDKNPPRVTQ